LADPTTDPERRFDRAWTIDLLRKVIAQLREEYIANVSSRERPQAPDRFDSIKIYLPGPEMDLPKYKEVAVGLGMTPDAVKQLVDRQRRRFAELLRERVREHVESADEVESEIRFLYGALAAPIPRSW
jgi:hypothetical protein